jgi:hypothetical protein
LFFVLGIGEASPLVALAPPCSFAGGSRADQSIARPAAMRAAVVAAAAMPISYGVGGANLSLRRARLRASLSLASAALVSLARGETGGGLISNSRDALGVVVMHFDRPCAMVCWPCRRARRRCGGCARGDFGLCGRRESFDTPPLARLVFVGRSRRCVWRRWVVHGSVVGVVKVVDDVTLVDVVSRVVVGRSVATRKRRRSGRGARLAVGGGLGLMPH